MVDKVYFFDSYATIEVLKSNPNYEIYKGCEAVMTKLNLFEVYFKLLKGAAEMDAEVFLTDHSNLAIDFSDAIIKLAAKFRFQHMNRNLSMADCIGYILAGSMGIKFLTGDEQFKDLENVEYVK